MIIPRIIPCLLLKKEGLVKTVKFKDPVYLGDPRNIMRIFNEKEVDEIPSSYKNIDEVMANQTDLVEVVHILKQVMCIKGG